jgi:glyoxylase-like metal-dependent hydrolase (beta-lactamase superfamily II)
MELQHFFDTVTSTLSYLVWDPSTRDAVVLDPVLDYDPAASRVSTRPLETLWGFVRSRGLTLRAILETHCHADHLTGAQALRAWSGAPVCIGAAVTEVQARFRGVYDLDDDPMATDGSQFDVLFADGQVSAFGSLRVEVLATPGHTPACVSYRLGDRCFTGDALFVEDYGTGRCDFPGGDAEALYRSIHDRLYRLPDDTRLLPGHDYLPDGRALRWETTVGVQKRSNVHLREETTREAFVALRTRRDAGLSAPRLLHPSLQVNLRAGHLPRCHGSGRRYFLVPVELAADATWEGVC